ncbi:MAG: hypothetical protein KC478_10880 [Bacteriovoracaceae bacterium]|nr:hypothetical protein [Bacteriovoracaceae bacterium]
MTKTQRRLLKSVLKMFRLTLRKSSILVVSDTLETEAWFLSAFDPRRVEKMNPNCLETFPKDLTTYECDQVDLSELRSHVEEQKRSGVLSVMSIVKERDQELIETYIDSYTGDLYHTGSPFEVVVWVSGRGERVEVLRHKWAPSREGAYRVREEEVDDEEKCA